MVKERDEVARRILTRSEMPTHIRATRELAEKMEAMSNEDRESEVKRYAQEIYTPIRTRQNEEGGTLHDTKLAFQRRVRAAVGTWTSAGEIRHVVKADRTKSPGAMREARERRQEKKAREDAETAEQIARTVATAFGMPGKTERSKTAPFPKLEARKAMLDIGKGRLAFQIRAILREMEEYNEPRAQKRILHERITRIADKIASLEHGPEDSELMELWATWDRGL